MPAPSKLLLRARLLRRERESENRRTRRQAGLRPTHSKEVESPVEASLLSVPSSRWMYPSVLPSIFEQETASAPPACARWTRYGMWADNGKQVLNERGDVIYESF